MKLFRGVVSIVILLSILGLVFDIYLSRLIEVGLFSFLFGSGSMFSILSFPIYIVFLLVFIVQEVNLFKKKSLGKSEILLDKVFSGYLLILILVTGIYIGFSSNGLIVDLTQGYLIPLLVLGHFIIWILQTIVSFRK